MLYEARRTTGGHRVGREDLKYFTRVQYVLTPVLSYNEVFENLNYFLIFSNERKNILSRLFGCIDNLKPEH